MSIVERNSFNYLLLRDFIFVKKILIIGPISKFLKLLLIDSPFCIFDDTLMWLYAFEDSEVLLKRDLAYLICLFQR